MKKLTVFLFVFITFGLTANAQNFPNKGAFEFGGSVGFSSTTAVANGQSSSDALTSISFQPYGGYFVINNLELGLIPSFMSQSLGDFSSTSYGVYFAPAWHFNLQSNVYPFLEGRIGYNTTSVEITDAGQTTESTANGMAWGFRGGVKVQLGNSSLVNFGLSYDQTTLNPENSDGRYGNNAFGVNVGFTVFLSGR